MGLVDFVDRISQLAPAPVLETVNRPVAGLDDGPVAVDHCRHLLALVRMDQKNDFIMTHYCLPVD